MLRKLGNILGLNAPENIKSIKFDSQNPEHLELIDDSLQTFAAKRDALLALDNKMLGAMAVDTFVWLSGFLGGWGPYLAAAGYLAILYSAKHAFGRDQLQREFDEALDELFEVYQWYAKDQTPSVTHQPKFQEMLEAMIPFVQDSRMLMLWDLSNVNHFEISDRFLEILEKAPRPVIYALNKPVKEPAKPMQTEQAIKLPDPQSWIYQSNPYKFFAETKANAKLRLLYAHQLKQDVVETPKPR